MLAYYRLDKWLFYNSDQHLQERIGTWWYTNSWLQGPLSKVILWPPQAWTYMHLFTEIIVSLSPSCAGQTVCSEWDFFLALFFCVCEFLDHSEHLTRPLTWGSLQNVPISHHCLWLNELKSLRVFRDRRWGRAVWRVNKACWEDVAQMIKR